MADNLRYLAPVDVDNKNRKNTAASRKRVLNISTTKIQIS